MSQASPPNDGRQVLRIIDANANRAGEGLRVVEEYARFVLDDQHLCRRLKQLRHRLTEALQGSEPQRVAMRNATGDVGRSVQVDAEYERPSDSSVAAASLNRVQQALRCLEEYSKQIDDRLAMEFEQIRYESYELERAVLLTQSSQDELADAQLYVLIDGTESEDEFRQRVGQLVKAGVHVLQLRDKQLNDRELLCASDGIARANARHFHENDRQRPAGLGVSSLADGVHVGQEELSVFDARRIVGPNKLIGVSTHSLSQAQQAVLDGANYIGVGPTFPSTTKHFDSHTGLTLLREVSEEISLPCFAIGGIDLDNLAEVLTTGITRVAVSGAVWRADDVHSSARAFLEQLRDASIATQTTRQVGSTR